MLHNSKKRARRRAYPIHAYVGANGGGKSAGMVWDTLPSLDAGRSVLSTVGLLDYANPRPCEGWQGRDERAGTDVTTGETIAVANLLLGERRDCDLCAA